MVRYHYRNGVTLEKKKSRWFLFLIGFIIIAAAVYVAAIYLAPQLVTIPFTSLTAGAVDQKVQSSKAGQYGDRLFIPQINVDVGIGEGGDQSQLETGVWQRTTSLGDPDKGGNFVLSGRKFTFDFALSRAREKSPFFNLGKLQNGDELTLDYKGKRYVYKVDQISQASASGNLEQKADGHRLTLYATDNHGSAVAGPVISAARISPATNQQATTGFGGTE